jgi:hypothetical protein
MRAVGTCLTSLFALTACLGGGGGGASSGGGGASTPAQLNLQLTSNPADFESAEYRRSGALEPINASMLYAAGASGAGVTVGIIDTGIDTGHAELASAIHPASTDLKRADPLADGSGHGTAVAGLIGARRNGSATHGVAYDARLLAVRADTPGSCPGACLFGQGDLAAATDYAVANGARVLNFSLGDAAGLADSFRDSLSDAAEADRVLVFAAGNGGAASPGQPARFATSGNARGTGIIVGAVDADEVITGFSNRAGTARDVYLVAPGEGLLTTATGGGSTTISGTSAATPLVSGAAAALLGAAPHLSASDVVSILLGSARDLGAPGTDAIYGRGMLDLEQALAPAGPLVVPQGASTGGGGAALAASSLSLGGAFGPGLAAPVRVMALDSFDRAYDVDLPLDSPTRQVSALPALLDRQRARSSERLGIGALSVELTGVAQGGERPLVADSDIAGLRATWRSGDDLQFRAHLGRPALTAGDQHGRLGPFDRSGGYGRAMSLADLAAPAGFEVSGRLAEGWRLSLAMAGDPGGSLDETFGLQQVAGGSSGDCCDQVTGRLATIGLEHGDPGTRAMRLGVGVLGEDEGPFGTSGSGALALDGATTYFVDLAATMALGDGLQAFGRAELGRTATAGGGGLVDEMADLWSTSFALGLSARDVARPADRLTFTVLQPLRVERGQAVLDVPVARDLGGNVYRQDVEVELTPTGREIDLELGYGLPLGSAGFGMGRLQTALMLRLTPNHDAAAAPELLFGVTYRLSF